MKIFKLWLILIIALAIFLRVWQVDKYPVGLNADEAAIGYNAYSLLTTGKDEYGTAFPLSFKSFGDYKPGLYFYFVIPFVAVLGLSELAVRLPSVILGVGTVILIYYLGRKLFKSEIVGILSAFLLAINPWHINFSRGGWETNAATFFITLGVYLFIKQIGSPKYTFFSFLSFLIAMYIYQSPRLVVPVLVLFLMAIYWSHFKNNIKKYLVFLVILIILSVPLGMQFLGGGGSERFNGLSFLSDQGPGNRVNELRGEHANPSEKQAKLFHNKLSAYGINFLGHYLDHFSANFLFINGDPIIRNRLPETGQFYLLCSIFLLAGLVLLITRRVENSKVLIIWILVAPLASSLTYQTPNAVRSLNMVVPLTLIMGFGLWGLVNYFKNLKLRGIVIFLIGIFLLFESFHYLESYYVHYPKRYPLAWEYGFFEMVGKLEKYQDQYQKVVITDRYDQPYILVLFYEKYLPSKYQPQAILSPRDKFNFGTVRKFDKYEFREIKPDEIKSSKDTLFIGTEKELPKDTSVLDQVNFPNGEVVFKFIKT